MKRWKHTAVLLLVILFVATMIKSESLYAAEDTVTINVTGTYGQSEARKMLDLINTFRTSGEANYKDKDNSALIQCGELNELTYDYELEAIAMQRAMEIAIYNSHTRPNGESCYTLNTVGQAKAENIAAGYRTYEEVFIGWREDNEDYDGQGHRRNMLSYKYNAIGIGHVVYNGTHYWVQEFSSTIQDSTEKQPVDKEQTISIDILSSNIIEKNIKVVPDSCSVEYGQTVALPSAQAQIKTTEGWPKNTFMPVDVAPEYSIEDPAYASIEQGSHIKGHKVGETNIVVSALGITKKVPLEITSASLQGADITLDDNIFTYDGEEQKPEVQSVTVNGSVVDPSNYTVSYDDNVDAGTAKVIVTGRGNYTGSAETTFIIQPRSLDSGQVLSITNQEYTGNEIKPTVQISVNNKTLYAGQDYEISYQNNINVGEAAVNITGKGNYTGSLTTSFQIIKKPITDGTVTQISDQEYTGEQITPQVTLTVDNKTLVEDKDYSLQYTNNTACGGAAIIITGQGNYSGELEVDFRIVPRNIAQCNIADFSEQIYDGQKKEPAVNISFNGNDLSRGTDYSVAYSNNRNAGQASVTISGSGNYTGTVTKYFTISQANIGDSQISAIPSQQYIGAPVKPQVTVKLNQYTLAEATDYTVRYEQNINAGQAKVIIQGTGNYNGTKEQVFQITAKSIAEGVVAEIPEQQYTGTGITPEITLTVDNATLKRNMDYKLQYVDNTNCGKAQIIITGTGNYTGNLSTEFKIVPRAINTCTINKIPEQKYTGTEICPSITISYNGKLLIQDVDYEIYYEDNIEIGEGKVIITGKDNYTGTTEITFLIVDEVTEEDPGDEPSVIPPENPGQPQNPSTQPSQQTPSAQQPQTPSASASSPAPAIGAPLVSSDKKTVYKVTGSNTVEYKKAGSNKAKVTIPSTVTYQGRKYQVTSIGTKAFKNNKKLKKVVIPSTVRKIGKQAFINCKKLKSITIKTNKLNAKAIGSKAFKGINAKATIKVPKKKLKLYKKILRAKGVSASVRIK